MKRLFAVLIIGLIITSCQEQNKIAFVDRTEVINKYQAKIDIEERFKKKNEAFIKRRDSLIQQYEFDRKEASIKAQRMSQAELQKLAQEYQQREALLGQQIQYEQQQLQQAFDTELDSTIAEVKRFVKQYGKDNSYTYIFGTSDATNTVMYGPEQDDISKLVLDKLNEAYKNKK